MKKIISMLVVLAMILSMVPAVFAAETTVLLSLTDEAVAATGYTFEYTAETAGTLNVTVGTCSPGWRYKIYSPDGSESIYRTKWTATETCDYTGDAGNWKIVFYAYSSSVAENVAGTVSFTVSFTPSEGESGGEVVKADYEISKTALTVGDNTLTMLETAVTTIYEFVPTENGIYQFTAPEGALVGYWGAGSFFVSDYTADKTNVLEYAMGEGKQKDVVEGTTGAVIGTEWSTPSIMIGVSGIEGEFTLNVAKIGEYEITETPIVVYENKATLSTFTVPEGAVLGKYVDVYSETTHTAVYSEADGYYHLDSVDGDVLLVDFNYMDIVLSDALKSDRPVMYAYTTDENGDDVKYDIGAAIQEYEAVMDENGYYPLTEDLILFYDTYAVGAGTYTFYLTGDYNEDCVWMYCMRTMDMDNVVIDPTDPSEPEETDPTDPSEPEETDPTETDPSETDPSETEPSEPAVVDPNALISVTNEAVTADGYVFEYTAATAGTLHVSVGECSPGWRYKVFSPDGIESGYRSKYTAGTGCDYYNELAGNWKIVFYAYSSTEASNVEGTVSFTVTFTPDEVTEPSEPETDPSEPEQTDPSEPETEPSEPETQPSESEPTEPSEPVELPENVLTMGTSVTASKEAPVVYTWTAEANGTLTVSMGAADPGWRYVITDAAGNTVGLAKTGSTAKSAEFTLVSGTTYTFTATGYEFDTWSETEADITYTLSFVPDESQGGEVEKNVYEVSATELAVGDNSLTMLDTAVTTIFKFKPTETGTYTFTAPEGATAGNWGSNASYLNDPGSTTNTCQWTCTGVGQSVYIGVSGIEGDFVLTIVKEVEETEPTDPSEPEETDPTEPSETEPSEPETEPTIPSVPDEDAPADAVYSVTIDGQTTYYTHTAASSINTVLKSITGTAYVKLYKDIALGSSISNALMFTSGNITLDLNGCTISFACASVGVLYVDGGTLIVVDTSADGDGLAENTNTSGYGIEVWNGTAYLKSGNVYGGSNAVRLYDAGDAFYMEGGTLSAQRYAVNAPTGSTAHISGGTLQATLANQYAFFAASGTTATITGGYFNGTVGGVGLTGNISGGYFIKSVSSSLIASGCELQDNDDAVYLYKVVDPNAVEPEPVYVAAVYANGQLVASYETVAAAIAAAEGGYVKLLMDVSEDITVSADLYLDLNGCTVSGAVTVAEGATLYGMDSATDDYDCADGYGKLTGTVTGNVATNFKSDITGAIKRYVTITEETGVSFHRIYMGVTKMSLKPGTVAIGYKAVFAGDDVVKAALAETGAFGIKVWVEGLEDNAITLSLDQADFVTGKCVTARIQGIDVTNYGDTAICAEAFLTVGEETITSARVSGSLKYMLETVNEVVDSYTAAQKTALAALVEKYYAVMSSWNVGNIYTAPDVDAPVEEADPVE